MPCADLRVLPYRTIAQMSNFFSFPTSSRVRGAAHCLPGLWQSWTCRTVTKPQRHQGPLSLHQETCSLRSQRELSSSALHFTGTLQAHALKEPQETPINFRPSPQMGQESPDLSASSFGQLPSPLPDHTRGEKILWKGCLWKWGLKVLVCSKQHRIDHWWGEGACRSRQPPAEMYITDTRNTGRGKELPHWGGIHAESQIHW